MFSITKYKLSDRLNAFLNDTILPKYKKDIENAIFTFFGNTGSPYTRTLCIQAYQTVHNVDFDLCIRPEDVEIVNK